MTESNTSIVTSLGEFEQLILIAKRHGITVLKLGGIEFALPPAQEKPESKPEIVRSESPDIDRIAYDTYKSL